MDKDIDLRRRRLLASGGALAAAGLGGASQVAAQASSSASPAQAKPLPPYVAWKDADSLIVHTPTTIETKRTAFGSSLITPAERLYIRNNLAAPDVSIIANRDAWSVAVEGVKQPRTLTVAELKSLGVDALPMVLQCSGNGRSYFREKVSGTPWKVGAAGCVIWSGVPLRAVVDALGGVAPGMRYITGTGGESIPAAVDPKSVMVERSVPIEMLNDSMLAWEMNGEPVPHAHGGPLRLIVPGYSGVNSVKYIKRLAFTANQTDAAIQSRRYRLNPIGTKADPSFPPVWEMEAKSWINSPAPEAGPVRSGWVQIHGVAMGGMSAARRVEVSLDGGKTWRDSAFFGPNLGPYAWRQFVTQAQLKPGKHVLASRATDSRGNVQVEDTPANADGYLNSGWRGHMIEITVV
jgi:DMSO/TMAO reductase YedYZ molybdopterin-dependent catalytic subunit